MLDEHQVPRGKQVSPLPVLHAVRQAAGLGAFSPVSASPAHHGGKEALAGHAYAQGSVGKGLNFHAGVCHPSEFRKGAFPGRHHSGKAQILQLLDALDIVDGHLCAGMQQKFRELTGNEGCHAQVLHQDGIRPRVPDEGEGVAQLRHFPVQHQCVDGDINPALPFVGIAYRLHEPFPVEIPGVASGPEGGQPQIDRIRAAGNGGRKRLPVARGTEQFHVSFHKNLKQKKRQMKLPLCGHVSCRIPRCSKVRRSMLFSPCSSISSSVSVMQVRMGTMPSAARVMMASSRICRSTYLAMRCTFSSGWSVTRA